MNSRWLLRFLRWQSRLSLGWAQRLGRWIGALMSWLPNRSARVTRRNLELCFPHWSQAERRRLEKSSLRELGCSLMEAGAFWYWPLPRLHELVTDVTGEDAFHAALSRRQGLNLLVPHLGAWELLVHWCAQHIDQAAVLYRAPRNEDLAELILNARQRSGVELVGADQSGVRRLLRLAPTEYTIGILPDQQPKQGEGEFAPFFGVQALTMVLAAKLIRRRSAPTLTGWCERLPKAAGYRMHFATVDERIRSPDLGVQLTTMNQAIEDCVRQCPSQYQWNYKRFSLRPSGEPSVYG